MSDAVSTSLEQPAAAAPSEKPQPAPAPAAAKRGNGLALLALLVAAAAGGVAGWSLLQQQAQQAREQLLIKQLNEATGATQSLARRDQQLQARLTELPTPAQLEERQRLLATVQGEQQVLAERLDRLLGESREHWRLAEAEHLLRLATLRLKALQDINSAEALVKAADDILREQDDPASFAAREQLALSLEALRSLPKPDRTGLFLQLAALREQVGGVQSLRPQFEKGAADNLNLLSEGDGQSWWADVWETLSPYFRIEFNAAQSVRPQLTGQGLAQVQLSISLALEQAQWAALNAQQEIYANALKQAEQNLTTYFNLDTPQSQALLARIQTLAAQPVAVAVPDLDPALAALQTYLRRHDSINAQPVPETPAATVEEEPAP